MINTTKHLAYTLKVDFKEIQFIIDNIDEFYYTKVKVKLSKNGKPKIKNGKVQNRVINPSTRRLKAIQKRIAKHILQSLEIPNYTFGGVKGKDNISNAKMHQGKRYNFTTDLAKFFPSISHIQVFEMFRTFGFSPSVSRCLTQLTTYKGKIPQGAPTSTMIANLVFIKTGNRLQELAKEFNLTFTSFVDDLTFSSPTDFKDKTHLLITALTEDGFRISHNKTKYKTKNPIVTGIVVKNNALDLPREFKEKLNKTKSYSEKRINGLRNYAKRVTG